MLAITYQTLLLVIPVILALVFFKSSSKHDPREPPRVHARIPVIGHILGIIRYGIPYYGVLFASLKTPLPAFTVDFLAQKTYVITTAELAAAVQRNSKTISFDPLLVAAAQRLAGITGDGLKLLDDKSNGGGDVSKQILHAMHPALLGENLDEMNRNMIGKLEVFLDGLSTTAAKAEIIDLHEWCKHAITVASTDSVYGPLNPYRVEGIEEAFWDYEANLTPLLMNIMPSITAKKAWTAREKMVKEFIKYYNADGHQNSSALAYGRWKAQDDHGATVENIARLETANGIGILSNTVPSTFWMLFYVYSCPELLQSLREEIRQHALQIDASTGTHTIDLAAIRDHCVLLVSTFQEMLRLRSIAAPTRFLHDDVLLANKYFLQKGAMLQMPSQCLNLEDSNWGKDAKEFNPTRFMGKAKLRSTGYMSFGSSPNICPGRHFASAEILAVVAMMFLRYDISPVCGSWKEPKLNGHAIASSMGPLAEEFPVTLASRKEAEGVQWRFSVTEGKGKFGLVVG